MLNITTEVVSSEVDEEKATSKKVSLKQYVLEKLRTWVNSFWRGNVTSFWDEGGTSRWMPSMTTIAMGIGGGRSTCSGWERSNCRYRGIGKGSSSRSGYRSGRDRTRSWRLS